MKQHEIDKEISSLDEQIAEVNREIEDRQNSYSESPNRSEFFDMIHSDEIQRLEQRVEALQLKRDSLELTSPDGEPTAKTRAAGVLLALCVSAVGILLGCCFIFDNSDLSWRQ